MPYSFSLPTQDSINWVNILNLGDFMFTNKEKNLTGSRSSFMRTLFVLVVVLPSVGCLENDMTDLRRFVTDTKESVVGKPLGPLPTVDPYNPFYYEAEGLKDPFSISFFVLDALNRQTEQVVVDSGIRPPDRPKEELEKYALGALDMVGTYQDFSGEDLWALIKAPDGIVHRVRKGNYLGLNFGEIYNITEDKIEILEIVSDPQAGGWKERDSTLSLAQ